MSVELWNRWNERGGPKYPHEKVIQFCFRTYSPEQRPRTRALDLGCGAGVHTAFLAREGFNTTGIDISPVGVAVTRDRLGAEALHAEVYVAAANTLDFPEGSFDLVICIGVYDCVGPLVARSSLERVAAVLRPGGRGLFIFASDQDFRLESENPYNLHGFNRAEVDHCFNVGFAQVWVDRYITTYQGGRIEQNDWLVTVER